MAPVASKGGGFEQKRMQKLPSDASDELLAACFQPNAIDGEHLPYNSSKTMSPPMAPPYVMMQQEMHGGAPWAHGLAMPPSWFPPAHPAHQHVHNMNMNGMMPGMSTPFGGGAPYQFHHAQQMSAQAQHLAAQAQVLQAKAAAATLTAQAQELIAAAARVEANVFQASNQNSSAVSGSPPGFGPSDAAYRKAAPAADDFRTTVMLRNIPNDYTRDMLLELLDTEGFARRYDFVYLPTDFKRMAGLGYAFVNLNTHEDAKRTWHHFQGFSSWRFASQKVCEVAWGQPLQGLQQHIERYRNSPVMHADVPEEFRPLLFSGGVRIPFPPPTKQLRQPQAKPGHKAAATP